MSSIKAVIMAGGSGTRLWPLSKSTCPKQFLPLFDDKTMIQSTFDRLSDLDIDSFVTICNLEHRHLIEEQLGQLLIKNQIILEPIGRNTAPAIAIAALLSKKDQLLLVLPSDHFIGDEQSFISSIIRAVPRACANKLVTFGILPDSPHSGYGYIERGQEENAGFRVRKFIEKPDTKKAREYLKSGNYYWNSGMFLFKADSYLAELKKYRPGIYSACEETLERSKNNSGFLNLDKKAFKNCPSESIDYAIMENTPNAEVIPIDADWNDIGSWESLFEICKKDKNGNTIIGDAILNNSSDMFIRSDGMKITTFGVKNLLIISHGDEIFIADKNMTDKIKKK